MTSYGDELELLLSAVHDAARGGLAPKDAVDALYTFCTERTPDEFALCSSALFADRRDAGVLRFLRAENAPYAGPQDDGAVNRASEHGQKLRRELLDFIAKYAAIVEEKLADHLLPLRRAALGVFDAEGSGREANEVRVSAMGVLLELMPLAARLGLGREFDAAEIHLRLHTALHTTGQGATALGRKNAPGLVVGACLRVLGALAEHFPTEVFNLGTAGCRFYVDRGLGTLYDNLLRRLSDVASGGASESGARGGAALGAPFALVSGVLDGLSSLLRGPMASARGRGLAPDEARRLYGQVVAFLARSQDESRYSARLSAIRLLAFHMAATFAPFAAADVAACAAAPAPDSTWALVLAACRHKNPDVRNHGKAALTALVRAVAAWIERATPAPDGAGEVRAAEAR